MLSQHLMGRDVVYIPVKPLSGGGGEGGRGRGREGERKRGRYNFT